MAAIPEHMIDSMTNWIEYGLPRPADMGAFMKAVLTNDLKRAAFHADEKNRAALVDWAVFLHNEVPSEAQGTIEALDRWHKRGGMRGRAA